MPRFIQWAKATCAVFGCTVAAAIFSFTFIVLYGWISGREGFIGDGILYLMIMSAFALPGFIAGAVWGSSILSVRHDERD